MAKIDGDDRELTEADAALIKGMLKRGDLQHHIAAYFGVDSRAVSHVNKEVTFKSVKAANGSSLPPPGPYRVDPIYVRFYQTMTKVNELWNRRKLGEAKELLEKALKNPVFSTELNDTDVIVASVVRDEFGISKIED